MKSTQTQKTFTMLEHSLWLTVLRIQKAMAGVGRNLARTCLTEPYSKYFRTQTKFSKSNDLEFQHVIIWNYYVGLDFVIDVGDNKKARRLTVSYRTPGKAGGRFQSQVEDSKVKDFLGVFTGCMPLTKALAIGDEEEQVELETLEMLWYYVSTHIFYDLHDQPAKSPEDFLKMVECVFNKDYFDIVGQCSKSLTVGNDLVTVDFNILDEKAVQVQVVYQIGDRKVRITNSISDVTQSFIIYPFCYTIRPLRAHLEQA